MLVDAPAYRGQLDRLESPPTKSEFLKETLAKTLYDLERAPTVRSFFDSLCPAGNGSESRPGSISVWGPVSRADVEELKTVILSDDAGQWRSAYMPAILKVERSQS